VNAGMNAPGPGNDEYETPGWFFDGLDTEFAFDYDAAARRSPTDVLLEGGETLHLPAPNYKCKDFTADIETAVAGRSDLIGRHVWCNPPYSKIPLFISAMQRSGAALWVLLLPVRTDNDWFGWLNREAEIRFLRRRISFELNGKRAGSPRFSSMVAIWRGDGS